MVQRHGRGHRGQKSGAAWLRMIKGVGAGIAVTIAGVAVFALLMQWLRPSDGVVRTFNQVLKLAAVVIGVWVAVGRGGEGGLLRGAAVGLVYMGLGVAMYAILSGQQVPLSAYLADLGMGAAGGGVAGLVLSGLPGR